MRVQAKHRVAARPVAAFRPSVRLLACLQRCTCGTSATHKSSLRRRACLPCRVGRGRVGPGCGACGAPCGARVTARVSVSSSIGRVLYITYSMHTEPARQQYYRTSYGTNYCEVQLSPPPDVCMPRACTMVACGAMAMRWRATVIRFGFH